MSDHPSAVGEEAPPPGWKNWQPPHVRGDALRRWAQAIAEIVAQQLLYRRSAEPSVSDLTTPIAQGANYAMDQSPLKKYQECQAGCIACCHVMIAVTAPEVLAIAEYIRDNLCAEEVVRIRQRAEQNAAAASQLDAAGYCVANLPCAMLNDEGECLVYPVRPLRCRGWCSFAKTACESCYLSGNSAATVPVDAHAYAVGQGAQAGLATGIKAAGLESEYYELNGALAHALDTPDISERWLGGEAVFAGCKEYT